MRGAQLGSAAREETGGTRAPPDPGRAVGAPSRPVPSSRDARQKFQPRTSSRRGSAALSAPGGPAGSGSHRAPLLPSPPTPGLRPGLFAAHAVPRSRDKAPGGAGERRAGGPGGTEGTGHGGGRRRHEAAPGPGRALTCHGLSPPGAVEPARRDLVVRHGRARGEGVGGGREGGRGKRERPLGAQRRPRPRARGAFIQTQLRLGRRPAVLRGRFRFRVRAAGAAMPGPPGAWELGRRAGPARMGPKAVNDGQSAAAVRLRGCEVPSSPSRLVVLRFYGRLVSYFPQLLGAAP